MIKNNNPGNIRVSNTKWLGKIPSTTPFENFSTLEYGVRAMILNIRYYKTHRKLGTLRELMSTWAPKSKTDNPDAYADIVAKATGVTGVDSQFPFTRNIIGKMVPAMAKVEHGPTSGSAVTTAMVLKVFDSLPLSYQKSVI